MIYLDNAASSYPKPTHVITAMEACIRDYAANPGRGTHQLAMRASRTLFEARSKAAKLFGIKNCDNVAFTKNATEALNLGIKGLLQRGDHVITSTLEHNSVRRPLEFLHKQGLIELTYVPADAQGRFYAEDIRPAIRDNTRLIAVTHGSNLTGTLMPIAEIGQIAKEHGIVLLVDVCQTAGVYPIDVEAMNIGLLAFTGHKSLYGPQGTGGLYIHPDLDLVPLMQGGTGGYSEWVEMPMTRPDRYEAGTPNTVGFAGLLAGLTFLEETGLANIRAHEEALTTVLHQGLLEIPGVEVYGPPLGEARVPIVSFTIAGFESHEIGFILDKNYNICVRSGLHCAPLAHETVGSIEHGLVRVSIGYFNTAEDIDAILQAVREIAG
ncbi:aminotransferase class V-fold PLP-dependent enzyme [Tumebacillus permanentifrigoris]|uniref:cysteine desulfurase n=1 Tax=Tumebacillus permanentifrigoris TaxID=378543 RepID=A0A316DH85_9BACL|nr:aminotransferase class V-fold PLP-dependent enzyme [Tumebacillus permanentifrigoris]PWK16599.1 cysteine desulfurase family protein [Tumebacillus permanentifrigoris]